MKSLVGIIILGLLPSLGSASSYCEHSYDGMLSCKSKAGKDSCLTVRKKINRISSINEKEKHINIQFKDHNKYNNETIIITPRLEYHFINPYKLLDGAFKVKIGTPTRTEIEYKFNPDGKECKTFSPRATEKKPIHINFSGRYESLTRQNSSSNKLTASPKAALAVPLAANQSFLYFFNNSKYLRYRNAKFTKYVDYYYPKTVREHWAGLPHNIDAAVNLGKGYYYFFVGDAYYKFSRQKNKVVSGYPKKTASHWKGWPKHWKKVDAAYKASKNAAVFFNGDEYLVFSIKKDHVFPGYPKKIANNFKNWPRIAGKPISDIDSAVVLRKNVVVFFKDGKYFEHYGNNQNHPAKFDKINYTTWRALNWTGYTSNK